MLEFNKLKKSGTAVFLDTNVLDNHLYIFGRSGAGKTVLFKRIYSQLKAQIILNREKANIITHAIKDDLVAENFTENDYILNPYDERGSDFNIMSLIEQEADITAIANAALNAVSSQSEDDRFWQDGGKDLFEGLLYMALYVANEDNSIKLNNFLLRNLKNIGIVAFATKLQEVVAKYPRAVNALSRIEIVLEDQSNKTAKSFWDFFMMSTKFLDIIKEDNNNEEIDLDNLIYNPQQQTVFLANYTDIKDEIAPYLTIFLTLYIKKLLAKSEKVKTKTYFFLDELGNLGKVDKLEELITLGRSKGGHVLLANQDIPRLEKIYTKEILAAILESCATNVVMNVGKETAKFFEELIGKKQVKRTDTSHTTAVFSERDSKGVNEKLVLEEVVLASELNNFKTLEFVFKTLGTDWVRVQSKFEPEIDKYEEIATGFDKTDRFNLNAREIIKQQNQEKWKKKEVEEDVV